MKFFLSNKLFLDEIPDTRGVILTDEEKSVIEDARKDTYSFNEELIIGIWDNTVAALAEWMHAWQWPDDNCWAFGNWIANTCTVGPKRYVREPTEGVPLNREEQIDD
jgi:hypothetical protein